MSITYIPPQKSGIEQFSEGFSPYLQMMVQAMMKEKIEEQERKLPMSRAETEKMQKQFEYDKQLAELKYKLPPNISNMIYGKKGGTRQTGFGTQVSGIGAEGRPTFTSDTPQEVFKRTSALRSEFIDRPEVKDYVNIKTQVGSMDSLLKYAATGAPNVNNPLDQALIMTYNKILDPSSVVRESEYARTPENLSTVNRVMGALEKFSEGGAGLTAEDRQSLVLGAKIIADERGKSFNEALKGYQKAATSAAVVPQDVIRSFRPAKKFQKGITKKEDTYDLKVGKQFMGKKILSIEPYRGD